MITRIRVLVFERFIALLCLLTLGSFASTAGAMFDGRNAAETYQRAFERLETLGLSDDDWTEVSNVSSQAGVPSDRARSIVGRALTVIDLASRGARLPINDFELRYEEGFELLLPHLAKFRQVARLMAADAVLRIQAGDHDTAARRIADMYRMAEHITDDRVLISTLVGQAVFRLAEATAEYAYERAAFNAAHSAALMGGVQQLGGRDPFNSLDAIVMEADIAIDWVSKKFDAEGDPSSIVGLLGEGPGAEAHAEKLAAIDSPELLEDELARYDEAMNVAIAAFAIDDRAEAAAMLDQLQRELENGEHGTLAMVLLPSLSRVLETTRDAEEAVAQRLDMLLKHSQGAVQEQELANAAHWYLRAIALWNALPADQRARIGRHAEIAEDAADESLAVAAKAVGEIITVLDEAAAVRRCDFGRVADREQPPLGPLYAVGMRELGRLLLAEARRALLAGDAATAGERLESAFVLSAHLSMDDMLLSSLVAQRVHEKAASLAGDALERGLLDDAARARLATAHERIGRTDPFGWVRAVAASRDRLVKWLRQHPPRDDGEPGRSIDAVATFDADRLLLVQVAFDTMVRSGQAGDAGDGAGDGIAEPPGHDALEPVLDDCVPREWLDRARHQTAEIAPLLNSVDLEAMARIAVAEGAPAMERLRAARGELRRTAAALRPNEESPPARATE